MAKMKENADSLLSCASTLRQEAKLCDVMLYVKNKRGNMVGYPAHKLVLINSSQYFKSLFERETLGSQCHFPTLSEDGLDILLNIVYDMPIPTDVDLNDALYAAKYFQVETAISIIEQQILENISNLSASTNSTEPVTILSSKHSVGNAGSLNIRRIQRKSGPSANKLWAQEDTSWLVDSTVNWENDEEHDHSLSTDDCNKQTTGYFDPVIVKVEPPSCDDTFTDNDSSAHVFPPYVSQRKDEKANDGQKHLPYGTMMDMSEDPVPVSMVAIPHLEKRSYRGMANEWKCDFCGKVFSEGWLMRRHRAIHTGEKPYNCDVCKKKFSRSDSLKLHQRVHMASFYCSKCSTTFMSENIYTAHLNECSPPDKTSLKFGNPNQTAMKVLPAYSME